MVTVEPLMSLLFNFARPPFDGLDEEARQRLGQHLSICYFRAGQTVQHAGEEPAGLYLIIKGAVEESAPHQSWRLWRGGHVRRPCPV